MGTDIDLLTIERGSITAPAGCGKTQMIADGLTQHELDKPVLILTHTNAGVVALRKRLAKAGVASKRYRLSTIDGWAMRVIGAFPARSGHHPAILKLDEQNDYDAIRKAAASLVALGHIDEVLRASYSRVLVDEYQDCNTLQHGIVLGLAERLPACVLGDPLQAIFGFSGPVVKWKKEVEPAFPPVGVLTTPWRWKKVGAEELGRWLLEDVRKLLAAKKPIDLRKTPAMVEWVPLRGDSTDHAVLRRTGLTPLASDEKALIIGFSKYPDKQRLLASQIPGAALIESVELKLLTRFSAKWDCHGSGALEELCEFAKDVLVGSAAGSLIARVGVLQRQSNKKPATEAEKAARQFADSPSYARAAQVLVELNREPAVRSHRRPVLLACIRALESCDGLKGNTFYEAAVKERERHRLIGRALPQRSVGSTLLLKGLEAEVAIVVDANALDPRNLYVALTRGSKRLFVCSPDPVLRPHEVHD